MYEMRPAATEMAPPVAAYTLLLLLEAAASPPLPFMNSRQAQSVLRSRGSHQLAAGEPLAVQSCRCERLRTHF